MPTHYLKYELEGNYIHNWLVAGPQAIPIPDLAPFEGADLKLRIARHYYEEATGITADPVERSSFAAGDAELTWEYYRCYDDHFVDLSGFHAAPHYLRSWAYAEVRCPAAQDVTFVLTTNGPADLWLNDRHIHRQEHSIHQEPRSASCRGALERGTNRILVRFEGVAIRECPYVMALQIAGLPVSEGALSKRHRALWARPEAFQPTTETDELPTEGAIVALPTPTPRVARRQMLEHVFEQAYVEGYAHNKGNKVIVHWDRDLDIKTSYLVQIQDRRKRIYVEAQQEAEPGRTVNIGHPARIWEGAYDVVIRPRGLEWYEHNTRVERRFPIRIVDHEYSDAPYGTYAERRTEAVEHVAKHDRNVYTQIARMALDRWDEVNVDQILETVEGINERRDCSDFYLVGLLGMLYRYGEEPNYPQALVQPLEACVLGFKYWLDEPGKDAMCYETENHSILFHTCEALAGQLYPDRLFPNANQTGQWHREKGEKLAFAWLYKRAQYGFVEWDSNCYFEHDLLALSHLASLTENAELQDLAAVVMDKLLFTLAVNSFKGAFGSTHGRTYAPMIVSAQLEATSGISRLMWGMGVWNRHTMGIVGLACSGYELPQIIADVAASQVPEMWHREHHPGVNKVTYRTPDYMLCSAQDYNPGQKGYQQHIWQATLGPNAVVFVTHPPCTSEAGPHRPSFWHGNYILPRVAQWKDALVAIHKLPDDDWMSFTHAHFPTGDFDEYRMRRGWAFARKGRAYLALWSSLGLELVKRGPSAYRELRSYGQENAWLCFLGRPDTDGSFEDFQKKVLALEVNVEGLSVQCQTHRDDTLSFGWEGPFVVNGEEQPLDGFKHYDGPFCTAEVGASQMDINNGEYIMRLDFAPKDDISPAGGTKGGT
jgi:hypothetical protein